MFGSSVAGAQEDENALLCGSMCNGLVHAAGLLRPI